MQNSKQHNGSIFTNTFIDSVNTLLTVYFVQGIILSIVESIKIWKA